ncbi:MAG: glycosyltransferase [Deltaproteobacteria bacterium]|jgi:spore maturation protein CgeB|nr:glycosyltransferase [Deltaproteobacteria bacterium]
MSENLPSNLSLALLALRETRGLLAREFLESEGQGGPEVAFERAADGEIVLSVGGQSQDSRREPLALNVALIGQNLPPGPLAAVFLFGLGSETLLKLLLEKARVVYAFEPQKTVAKAFFGREDRSALLLQGRLVFLSPYNLFEGLTLPPSPFLLAHPPSARRAPAIYERFKATVLGRALPGPLPGERLKILLAPPFSGGSLSLELFLREAARELGFKAVSVAYGQDLIREAARLARPGPPDAAALKALFAAALKEIELAAVKFNPHLLLALSQAPLDLPGLKTLKERLPCPLAFWFVEDYERFPYARDVAPAYDLFFHIQGPFMTPFARELGLNQAYYLPLAACPQSFYPLPNPEEKYRSVLSFMGAGYPNRRALLSALAQNYWLPSGKASRDFKIFGSGWDGCPPVARSLLFESGRRVTLEETLQIFAGGQINLNIHSGMGQGFDRKSAFVNPRTFEIALTGAFQISDARFLLPGLFTQDELARAENPEELPDLIEYYLRRPDERRAKALSARQRVLGEHLYSHRLRTLLSLAFPGEAL